MNNGKRRNKIFPFLMAAFFILVLLALGAMLYLLQTNTAALEDALAASEMELALRRTATEQAAVLEKNEDEAYEAEVAARAELRKEMMLRDREQLLMLVNPENSLPEDYVPRLVPIGDDLIIDERCAVPLAEMIMDCKKASLDTHPVPISAYRTQEYQQELFEGKVERVIAAGVSPAFAQTEAAKEVARPGTSEHQTGLAVDISDAYHTDLDYGQEWTATQQWLMAHCTDYGFILRYPNGTTDITGIIYEPWHYRYVGMETAKEIKDYGITLEEYLQMKKSQAGGA